MKISPLKVERIRQQALMDWFRDHQFELSYAQHEYYESIRKQLYEGRPLTEKQITVLNDIKKHLSPDKELIIRQNF